LSPLSSSSSSGSPYRVRSGYDASKTELWIFMDYCAGGDLHQSLKSFGGLTAALAARYTYQILLGLDYLHGHNVLHRDIKGANILLTIAGQAKLSDFGLATMFASESGKSSMFAGSEVVGSPYWMAPEVITGKGSKRASDIWSLGSTVYEMAHTTPPNANMEPMAALFHVGSNRQMPEPPAQLGDTGVHFVKQCWRYTSTERPNCAALLDHPFLSKHRLVPAGSPRRIPTD
jgi:serine/threonine protein kinase